MQCRSVKANPVDAIPVNCNTTDCNSVSCLPVPCIAGPCNPIPCTSVPCDPVPCIPVECIPSAPVPLVSLVGVVQSPKVNLAKTRTSPPKSITSLIARHFTRTPQTNEYLVMTYNPGTKEFEYSNDVPANAINVKLIQSQVIRAEAIRKIFNTNHIVGINNGTVFNYAIYKYNTV